MGYRDGDIPETDDELYGFIDAPHAFALLEGQPCACASRYYGGDCQHTTSPEAEEELARALEADRVEFEQFERGASVRIRRDADTVFANRPGLVESQHPETGTVFVKLAIDDQRYAVALPFAASDVQEEDL